MSIKKKVYYWSPFLTKIATINAVTSSAESLTRYSNDYSPKIINACGEFNFYSNKIDEVKIEKILLQKVIKNHFLPKEGFLKSRISYWLIFIFSFIPLYKILKKDNPEFFIIHLISSLPLSILLFFNFKTKFILRISGFPKMNFLRKTLWKLTAKKLYKISCPTEETLDYLKKMKIFSEDKIILLRDPIVDINKINQLKKNVSNQVDQKEFLLGIGRLTKQKNFEFLIKCFKIITKKYPNLDLIILGEGEKREDLKLLVNDYDLNDKVFLKGYSKNVHSYLSRCKAFILSSLWEDPGFVLVEAIYNNCNIISSNCRSGPKEILKNGDGGYLFESNSTESFINVFNLFMEDKEKNLFNKKKVAKKNIKQFTIFKHYIKLKKILDHHAIS